MQQLGGCKIECDWYTLEFNFQNSFVEFVVNTQLRVVDTFDCGGRGRQDTPLPVSSWSTWKPVRRGKSADFKNDSGEKRYRTKDAMN